jgi:hypothetical protein
MKRLFGHLSPMSALFLGLVFAHPLSLAQELPQAVAVPEKNENAGKTPGTPVEKFNSKVRPLNVTVELSNGTSLAGTLVEVDVVLVKTAFGEASVPLAEIAGIRFPQGDDVSTSIVMLNGDSITGATDVKRVTVDTDWGQALVNGSSVRSILFIPNLQWTPLTGISGKRWTLQEAKPAPTPGPTQSGSSIPNSTTSNRLPVPGPTSNPSFVPGSQPSGTPTVIPGSSTPFFSPGTPLPRNN